MFKINNNDVELEMFSCFVSAEDEDEKGLTSLMERLRSKEKMNTSRSWQDTCKLWKHSVTVSTSVRPLAGYVQNMEKVCH
jgi:hypothetical protein